MNTNNKSNLAFNSSNYIITIQNNYIVITIKFKEVCSMIKANRVKHTVGSFFYEDKVKPSRSRKVEFLQKKTKRFLYSRKLKSYEDIIYIEIRKNFFFNYVQFLTIQRNKRNYISNINHATSFLVCPRIEVPIKETFPRTRHLVIAFPKKLWNETKNKLELLYHFYPQNHYPDLYQTPHQ